MKNKMSWLGAICHSLGAKASDDKSDADRVCYLRAIGFLVPFITCFFITAGVIHKW